MLHILVHHSARHSPHQNNIIKKLTNINLDTFWISITLKFKRSLPQDTHLVLRYAVAPSVQQKGGTILQ